MNTTASFSSELSWISASSRRGSTETILSIQGKETDFVRDTTDTESLSDVEHDVQYEPVTESEDEGPLAGDSTGGSDNEIIATKVIEISVRDDGDLEFADSEQDNSESCDSEMDLYDYWKCAQCHVENNNPLYRYCEKCFKVRKNFFPPRPKRRHDTVTVLPRCLSQDSGVESASASQDLSQPDNDTRIDNVDNYRHNPNPVNIDSIDTHNSIDSESLNYPNVSIHGNAETILDNAITKDSVLNNENHTPVENNESTVQSVGENKNAISTDLIPKDISESEKKESKCKHSPIKMKAINALNGPIKRRAESADRYNKRIKLTSTTDSDSDIEYERHRQSKSADPDIKPLIKTTSDPSLTIDEVDAVSVLDKKELVNSLSENIAIKDNLCIVCFAEPKSGVFVHGRIAHICCCYKCAVKVWTKAKRCPVCNCKVSNVLKAVVM